MTKTQITLTKNAMVGSAIYPFDEIRVLANTVRYPFKKTLTFIPNPLLSETEKANGNCSTQIFDFCDIQERIVIEGVLDGEEINQNPAGATIRSSQYVMQKIQEMLRKGDDIIVTIIGNLTTIYSANGTTAGEYVCNVEDAEFTEFATDAPNPYITYRITFVVGKKAT